MQLHDIDEKGKTPRLYSSLSSNVTEVTAASIQPTIGLRTSSIRTPTTHIECPIRLILCLLYQAPRDGAICERLAAMFAGRCCVHFGLGIHLAPSWVRWVFATRMVFLASSFSVGAHWIGRKSSPHTSARCVGYAMPNFHCWP